MKLHRHSRTLETSLFLHIESDRTILTHEYTHSGRGSCIHFTVDQGFQSPSFFVCLPRFFFVRFVVVTLPITVMNCIGTRNCDDIKSHQIYGSVSRRGELIALRRKFVGQSTPCYFRRGQKNREIKTSNARMIHSPIVH